ncbi:MAG TPA: CPBP family glutamic-type intramembrane protease [Candidatus Obscuribacter sp.]|nr:CPBP family glutamic-type intramembrane protease [Candidatus Obscuribacter sp.]
MSALGRKQKSQQASERQALLLLSAMVVSAAVAACFEPFKQYVEEAGFYQPPDWFAIVCGICAGILSVVWNEVVNRSLDKRGLNETPAPIHYVAFLLVISFVTPIAEEIIFRGVLQQLIGYSPASILFALAHFESASVWNMLLSKFPLGLFCGGAFVVSHNLWSAVIAHTINNVWFTVPEYFRDRDVVKGVKLSLDGNYEGAIEILSRTKGLEGNRYALRNRASCFNQIKKCNEAIADATKAIELGDNYAYLMRCSSYLLLGKTELAEQDVVFAKKKYPKCSEPYLLAGVVYLQKLEFTAARSEFLMSIEIAETPVGWALCGCAALSLFQYDLCLEDCRKALSLNPSYYFAFQVKALALLALNKLEDAMICSNQAVENASPHGLPETLAGRAMIFIRVGDKESALADLSNAIAAVPESKMPNLSRAFIYIQEERFEGAFAELDQLSRLVETPLDRSYHLGYRALAKVLKGDVESGLADAIEANSIYPSRPDLLNILGLALIRNGQAGQAVEELNRAIELDPYNAESYWFRHLAYESLGQDELASADKGIAEKYCYKPYC